jgi:hypothetical protein
MLATHSLSKGASMHFFYLDEAGCNGRDLNNAEQPIFVIGSLVVSDEKWNRTNLGFSELITEYFDNVPENFELHSEQLLSPEGDGPFIGHDRDRRNQLVEQLLDLIIEKSHHTAYFAIDKRKLMESHPTDLRIKNYLDFRAPYLVSFDYMISLFEWYTKERLGQSAQAMIILDEKHEFEDEIRSVVRYQKYLVPDNRRLKWIVEFTYPISSHINPMVQLADLVSFLTKKYLEIENGYRDEYPSDVKDVYRGFYSKIDQRLIRKTVVRYDRRARAESYYEFLEGISSTPIRGWRDRIY